MSTAMQRLLAIMAQLRNPDGGCAWDLEQTFATIAPYTIEEAYEVAEAIARGDMTELRDELGDLLLQVVFHAQMATEGGHFTFDEVAEAISAKMIRRHPHVFGDAETRSAEEQTAAWDAQKAAERAARGAVSVLDGVSVALPGLTRAEKLTARAARVGFDWPDARAVLAKLHEETAEITEVMNHGSDRDRLEDELGDLLFVCANLARKLDLDAEAAIRRANAKFTRRFQFIERGLAGSGRTCTDATLDEMEALWLAAKQHEQKQKS